MGKISNIAHETITVDSGSLNQITYTRNDFDTGIQVKKIVGDIYFRLPDFKENIIWLSNVKPNDSKTISDVLDDYTKKYGEDKFVMCQAGLLTSEMPASGSTSTGKEFIESQKGYILEAYFYNIFFNRMMSHSYGNKDLCIYSNDKTEAWIKENMGDKKIINRVVASSKVS